MKLLELQEIDTSDLKVRVVSKLEELDKLFFSPIENPSGNQRDISKKEIDDLKVEFTELMNHYTHSCF